MEMRGVFTRERTKRMQTVPNAREEAQARTAVLATLKISIMSAPLPLPQSKSGENLLKKFHLPTISIVMGPPS